VTNARTRGCFPLAKDVREMERTEYHNYRKHNRPIAERIEERLFVLADDVWLVVDCTSNLRRRISLKNTAHTSRYPSTTLSKGGTSAERPCVATSDQRSLVTKCATERVAYIYKMAPTKKASSSASSLSQLAVGEPEQQEPEQQSVSALSPREALGKGAKLIKNATEVLERLATLSPAWTMRTVAFVQLVVEDCCYLANVLTSNPCIRQNVCFLLVLFCLFLGRKFYIVDSVVYYSLMMPLAIAVLLCVALPEKDVWRVRVMVTVRAFFFFFNSFVDSFF